MPVVEMGNVSDYKVDLGSISSRDICLPSVVRRRVIVLR